MNIKITSKNGVTLNTANKYVKEDIAITIDESFVQPSGTLEVTENGTHDVTNYESVNVNVPTSGGESAEGTAVPNSGYVEKVYFNTSLSNEKVNGMLDNLSYTDVQGVPTYFVTCPETVLPLIACSKFFDESLNDYGYAIALVTDLAQGEMTYIYTYNTFDYSNDDYFENGFKMSELDYNKNLVDGMNIIGMLVGLENDKIANLVSTTPFGNGSCEPTGLPIEVSELPTLGTVVPTSGMIEKIYVNTSLSTQEVIDILETLTFVPFNDSTYIWACLADSTMTTGLAITRWQQDDGYAYMIVCNINGNETSIFERNFVDTSLNGWSQDFNGVIEFNIENQLGLIAPNLGFTPENEKAENLFSVTPFNSDINPNAIYALVQNNVEVWTLIDGELVNVGELVKEEGATFEIYFVQDIPLAENMLPSTDSEIYIYWIESENDGYLLMDGQVLKYSETFGGDMPISGVVTSLDEIIADGLYILKSDTRKYYKYENGWVELNVGSGKIEIYEIGDVPIPTKGSVDYVLNNFSKTKEETIQILSTLSISNGETYVVLANADGSKRLTINKNNGVYSISDEKSVLWDGIEEKIFILYSFSDNASPTTVIDGTEYQVGTENEKLITLFTTRLDETMFTGGKLTLYELKENLVAEKGFLFKNGTYDLSKYLSENKIPFKISVDLPYATLKDYGYRGTPIITNPIIDKVYLNINMTPDEINDYLSTIENHKLTPGTGRETYASIFYTENFSLNVDSSSDSKGERTKIKIYGTANGVSTTYFEYFYNTKTGGWKSDFDGIINVNEPPVQNLYNIGSKNQPAGVEYTRLISGTPFVSGQELDGEYDTTPVSVDIYDSGEIDIAELVNKQKIPSKLTVNVTSDPSLEPIIIQSGKKAVPESGYVRKIYINSKLKGEEINVLCNQLTFVNNAYYVFLGKHFKDSVIISKVGENQFYISGPNNTPYYQLGNWDVSSLDDYNSLILNDIQDESVKKLYPIGSQNDILINLFSTTPHHSKSTEFRIPTGEYSGQNVEVQENGELNITSLIETNKNLPFSIDVNVKQGVPIEIDNEVDMNVLLIPENADKIFKYVGSTGKYKHNSLYQVKKVVS